jgi:drug/metabolite transporter (DMT)-like permease
MASHGVLENIGVLAAIGAMLCWGFGDFFIQKTARKLGDVEALFFIGLFGAVALFPFIYGELPLVFSNSNVLAALFFLGFSTLVVSIVNFQALKEGKISVVEPVLELELPLTILFAMSVLRESLTPLQLILSSAVFLGVILISVSKLDFRNRHFLEKGALLAVVTSFGFAFINVFTGSMARQTSPLLAIWSAWTVFSIFCLAYLWHKKGPARIVTDAIRSEKLVFAESILDTAAWVLFAIAMVNIPVSMATAISESYPAIAIFLGIVVNKEMVKRHQFAGMGLALVSSIALALLV